MDADCVDMPYVELEGEAQSSLEVVPTFNFLPTEILCRIFNNLELRDRGVAERVCSRWRKVLKSRDCPLADVAVVNVFEPVIWMDSITRNQYSTVKGTFVNGFEGLRNLFQNITSAHTAKLWFQSEKFAKKCIDVIADVLDVKCVDIYPYADVHILPYLHQRLPNLPALYMRPHSQELRNSGFRLPSFPNFSRLTTLVLDNCSVDSGVEFPRTITSLDYSKRDQSNYRNLLPKLKNLVNLEYLTLSNVDMSNAEDTELFVRTVCNRQLPKLDVLILRMCRMYPLNLQNKGVEMNLRMIKFDLCYENVLAQIQNFLDMSKKLNILALNVLCTRSALDTVCSVCCELRRRRIGLHLSILQNHLYTESFSSPFVDLVPPPALFDVLSKFEASFVEDDVLLQVLLMSGTFYALRECKFVECNALTTAVLQHLSVSAPVLHKIGVFSCTKPNDMDVLLFISNLSHRVTERLQIIWRREGHTGSLASCYLALLNEHKKTMNGKKARFLSKTFSENDSGEEIFVWEMETSKLVHIRNYNDRQKYRTFGFIVEEDERFKDAKA